LGHCREAGRAEALNLKAPSRLGTNIGKPPRDLELPALSTRRRASDPRGTYCHHSGHYYSRLSPPHPDLQCRTTLTSHQMLHLKLGCHQRYNPSISFSSSTTLLPRSGSSCSSTPIQFTNAHFALRVFLTCSTTPFEPHSMASLNNGPRQLRC
jgi:hypothetical protein